MHIPTSPTTYIDVLPFEEALTEALNPHPDYEVNDWLYVPNRYDEYRYETAERTDDELLALGYSALDSLLCKELAESELLSKEISTELSEGSLILRCKVRCIEDIARVQEIKIDGLP